MRYAGQRHPSILGNEIGHETPTNHMTYGAAYERGIKRVMLLTH